MTPQQVDIYAVLSDSKNPLCGSEIAKRVGIKLIPAYREIHELIKAGYVFRTYSGAFVTDTQSQALPPVELTPLAEALRITEQPANAPCEMLDDSLEDSDAVWIIPADEIPDDDAKESQPVDEQPTNAGAAVIQRALNKKEADLQERVYQAVAKARRPLDTLEVTKAVNGEFYAVCRALNQLFREKRINRTNECRFFVADKEDHR